ncbi:Homeobox-leucine zipper protein HOX32 [Platanthera guangdongensis]|uniref:Homeobox-leucine zipper protein HOX32 n=1 Tax=Platanthera guangdongensis TaxID=2320717 RepID=A0ABR2MPG6_9ASPA
MGCSEEIFRNILTIIFVQAWSVPEVLRPLYESPKNLAQKLTIVALRHIKHIAQERNNETSFTVGQQPTVLRTFSQRLSRGFNDVINGFFDDGWCLMGSDGVEYVTITMNSYPNKFLDSHSLNGGILCAKASMLLQNVPPALLVRFLRVHHLEWVNFGVDSYSVASLRASTFVVPGLTISGGFLGSHFIIPLAQTIENEEVLEVVRLESHGFIQEDVLSRVMYLLQLCSGIDESDVGSCAQLVFAPIDESFADDAFLLPSGFRVILLDSKSVQYLSL